ncbi:retrovirus-related Pol polyprotein from transposon TNT 1-94 [Trichonephila clavipes]|nr:retrovirus-related Pol polyprotein from transposon TNT 1-94 [Trichonephila clavipes]
MRAKMGIMMGYAQRTKGYRIWLTDENKLVESINVGFDENKRGINFRQKVNSNLGYNLNLPDYYDDDEDDFDRVKDSLTSHLVSKTSTEMPSTSEKPGVSSDNHNLISCTEVKWIRNIGRKVTGSNVYYSIEGEATRLKSFNEIERYCKRHNIEYDPSLFNFGKDNTESQGFSDLSEQQEALMVEVTIPNCYKQAIRSRDASKWNDAMDKEINVMKERKVWDLVDHPDNIKILENRWVYTIKYDENNKIVRYKACLVARGNTQLRGESFDEVFSPVINFTIVRLFFTICVCLWKWTHIQVDITNAYLYANLDTVIYMKQPTGYEIDNNKVYSDFATNRDDRVSMGGFITFIDETPISWRTFKQKSVILSTMEADSGRPRGTTPADDRYIVLQSRRNRRQTAGEIARHTTQATGRPISRFTVARRLHGGGLFARRPVRCVPLTPAHRRRRSLWCREHGIGETMNGDEYSLQMRADSV